MKRVKQIKRSHFLVLNMWWYVYSWFLFYYLNCKLFIYWLNVNNLYARKPINPQQHITTILSLMELEMVTRTFTFIVVRKHFIWFFLLLSRAQYIEAKIHIHTIYIYKYPFAILYIAFNAGSFNKCGSLSVFFFLLLSSIWVQLPSAIHAIAFGFAFLFSLQSNALIHTYECLNGIYINALRSLFFFFLQFKRYEKVKQLQQKDRNKKKIIHSSYTIIPHSTMNIWKQSSHIV